MKPIYQQLKNWVKLFLLLLFYYNFLLLKVCLVFVLLGFVQLCSVFFPPKDVASQDFVRFVEIAEGALLIVTVSFLKGCVFLSFT